MTAETHMTENGLANGHNGVQMNGGHRVTNVDDHYAFFKSICDRANDYYLVQKAKGTYETTKHSCGLLERTLGKVEDRVQDVAQYTSPYYETYVFPATDRLIGLYNKSVDTSKTAVDKTKSTAVTAGTLGLGLTLVATQMGLIAGTAATNLFLDGIIATKQAGGKAISAGYNAEKTVEHYIHEAIRVSKELAAQPKDKATEHANTFLDISNAVFDRLLNLPATSENPESSLPQRISHLANRIAGGLSNQANQTIVEPCQRQVHAVVVQLQRGLVLVDYVKKQKQWTFQQAGQFSASVNEIRTKVEHEAKQAYTTPEEALLRHIRNSSAKLNECLTKLRASAAEVLRESMQKKLESTSAYVEQLDTNFVKANNIYQVKDEVLDEAKLKLQEIAQWTSALVTKNGTTDQSSSASSSSSN